MKKHKWRRIHLGKMVAIAASGFQGNGVEILPHRSVVIMMAKNQVLYVHLTSSVLRQELMMGRELLVRNLNQQVGAQVIVNIIFR